MSGEPFFYFFKVFDIAPVRNYGSADDVIPTLSMGTLKKSNGVASLILTLLKSEKNEKH